MRPTAQVSHLLHTIPYTAVWVGAIAGMVGMSDRGGGDVGLCDRGGGAGFKDGG